MAYGYSNKIAYFEGFLEVKESKEMFLSSILVEPFSKGQKLQNLCLWVTGIRKVQGDDL